MKKTLLTIGKTLNKNEQKQIQGGFHSCHSSLECSRPFDCCSNGTCINAAFAFYAPYCS